MTHYPNPMFEQLFVVPEAGYGVLAEPPSVSAVRHVRASFAPGQARAEREDRHGSRGVAERISRRKTMKWDIEGYAIPGGSPGSAPECANLLAACGLSASGGTATTVAASPAPTATSCGLVDADAAAIGDAVGFTIGGVHYLRVVTGKAGAVITFSPSLSQAPVAGDAIRPAVRYAPAADPQTSVSLWRFLDGAVFAYPGCVGESWELTVSGGGEARLRFKGLGGEERTGGTDALTQGINAQATQIAVEDAGRFEAGVVLRIGVERLKVVAADAGTNIVTVERGYGGTTPVSHSAHIAVSPYQPDASAPGHPIAGILGSFRLGGGEFEITEASMEVKEGVRLRETFGTDVPSGFSYPDRRRAQLTLSGFLTLDTHGDYGAAKRFVAREVFLQAGTAAGRCLALRAPLFEADIPEISAEPGQEVPLKLSGPCLESAGDDEVGLIFG